MTADGMEVDATGPASDEDAFQTAMPTVGFAKLTGIGDGNDAILEPYFIQKYEVILGRQSKSANVDVVLGQSMNVSRCHAKIVYNFEKRHFQLEVCGKNGLIHNGTIYMTGEGPVTLASQDSIEIGGKRLFFLLPRDEEVNS